MCKPTTSESSTIAREKVLRKAIEVITHDRNQNYGPPEDNFYDIGKMYDIYKGNPEGTTKRHDVAVFMMLVKICRIKTSPTKEDNWVDSAGYSGCGYEAALKDFE